MMMQLADFEKEWVERELSFYEGTSVEMIDVIIGHLRISHIFNIPAKDIRAEFRFGKELNSTFESILRTNELSRISYDIEDLVSILGSKETLNAVNTVKDYVILLSRCRLSQNLRDYKKLIEDWLDLFYATGFGRLLKNLIGFLPKKFVKKNHLEIVEIARSFIEGIGVRP